MKVSHGIAVALLLCGSSVRAGDLSSDHAQWPPAVFSSAYRLIATDAEQAALDTLTGPARTYLLVRFWMRRDPTPSTPENEFKEQFRERVETALLQFRTVNIQNPWDERGKVYIKFGEPDDRQDSVDFWYAPMDSVRASRGMDPNYFKREFGEVWYYFGRNLVLQFQGYNLDYQLVPYVSAEGDYQPLFDFDERVHEVDTAVTTYVSPLGRDEMSLALAWYPFRREDGQYDVYFASAFPVSAMASPGDYGHYSLSYSASVTVRNDEMSTVWSDQVSTLKEFEGPIRGLSAQNGFSHVLPPGYYFIGGEVLSRDSVHHAAAAQEGLLVSYAEKVELDLSALVIAAYISDAPEGSTAFVRNGKQIIPVPGATFGKGQSLYFYHEVYNLTPSAEGQCRYHICYKLYEHKHKRERVLTERTFETTETKTFHSGGIPGKTLKKGEYILEAKIDDLVATKTKVALARFKID